MEEIQLIEKMIKKIPTRVPESYGEAKLLCSKDDINWTETKDSRYKISPYCPNGKKERWLLVRSDPAFKRENETFLKRHEKYLNELQKALWHCSCQVFNCEKDAKKAIEKIILTKKHFYNVSYDITQKPCFSNKGRPTKNQLPNNIYYQINITGISSDLIKINKKREILGRFVLATNVLDDAVISDESMLFDYKDQGEIEKGFRFIKNDTFGLDEVYLKKPERIGALMGVMTLCLLIYGLTQYRLRDALSKNNEALPDQKKKPTQTPTLMWIFTLFSSVIMINTTSKDGNEKRIVLNLYPFHQKVILLLGETARRIYLLPDTIRLNDIELNQKNWLGWCGM